MPFLACNDRRAGDNCSTATPGTQTAFANAFSPCLFKINYEFYVCCTYDSECPNLVWENHLGELEDDVTYSRP